MTSSGSSKLWGGRFSGEMSEIVERFNASIDFDKRLYREDIAGSIAHAHMLAAQGIIPAEDAEAIERALRIAERLRLAFSEMSFQSEVQTFSATLSVGLAEYISGESAENLKMRADKALYAAKASGRNCAVLGKGD